MSNYSVSVVISKTEWQMTRWFGLLMLQAVMIMLVDRKMNTSYRPVISN